VGRRRQDRARRQGLLVSGSLPEGAGGRTLRIKVSPTLSCAKASGRSGLKATLIEANGARTPLPIDGDGRFERTPTLAQLQAKAQVSFDVPADTKLGSTMLLDPVLKPAAEYDARELVATVEESNKAIRKAAGPMA
jgi:hypothetical protein